MQSGKTMGRQLMAIALGSRPPVWEWALCGETAAVFLASVSVLKAGDFEAWAAQRDSLAALERENPVKLEVPGVRGDPSIVRADVAIREFVLWADKPELVETSPYGTAEARAGRLEQLRRLLGDEHSEDLGGAVAEADESIESIVQELRAALDAHTGDHERSVAEHGGDHPESLDFGRFCANRQKELAYFERQRRALREAAGQLKAIWLENGDWPAGVESHRPAAARLALVAHLLGETPLLNCGGDSNLTAQLDSDAKLLATVADSQDGRLPPGQSRRSRVARRSAGLRGRAVGRTRRAYGALLEIRKPHEGAVVAVGEFAHQRGESVDAGVGAAAGARENRRR